jgi:hypothetical protein
VDCIDTVPSFSTNDCVPTEDCDAVLPRALSRTAARLRPAINDCRNINSGAGERECGVVSAVIVGEYDCPRSGPHATADSRVRAPPKNIASFPSFIFVPPIVAIVNCDRSTAVREGRGQPFGKAWRLAVELARRDTEGPMWVHEIKHDGFRVLVNKREDRVRLFRALPCSFETRDSSTRPERFDKISLWDEITLSSHGTSPHVAKQVALT